ncbi:hypothetical protein ACIQM3_27675 [Streptomyces sp. NPDC091271]|uniref:hypothetical protein n=1 Tax=Streptomyces sp. NPDC091271 TaxID=3365980 RepID=UPI0038134B21
MGIVLGLRFLWSAVVIADDAASRVVMSVAGLLVGGLLGILYGSWLLRRWGTALLFRCIRIGWTDAVPPSGRKTPAIVLPSGSTERRQRNALLVVDLSAAVAGCAAIGVLP